MACSTSLLQALVKKPMDNLSVDRSGQNVFHYVCHFGDVEKFKVIEPIMSEEAKRAQDNYGQTPFHLAVSEGNGQVLRSLFQHGFDNNVQDSTGDTAFHIACRNGRKDVLEVFLQNKEKVDFSRMFHPLDILKRTLGMKNHLV